MKYGKHYFQESKTKSISTHPSVDIVDPHGPPLHVDQVPHLAQNKRLGALSLQPVSGDGEARGFVQVLLGQ